MDNKFIYEDTLENLDYYFMEPTTDNRMWESYVEDIDGGSNFADFCEEFFELLEEEEYWEN